MVPSIRRNFDEGGRPPWEPLSEFTLTRRAKEGSGTKILNRTGTLRKVASQVNIWTITTTTARIDNLPSSAWYGKVHQAGYNGSMRALLVKHKGNVQKATTEYNYYKRQGISDDAGAIPQRQFLMIQPEDELAIYEIFMTWLGERVTRAFGVEV
jgi:phage gpG-like protein